MARCRTGGRRDRRKESSPSGVRHRRSTFVGGLDADGQQTWTGVVPRHADAQKRLLAPSYPKAWGLLRQGRAS